MRPSRRTLRSSLLFLLCAAGAIVSISRAATPEDGIVRSRVVQSFDPDWRFLKSDEKGAEDPAFDDSQWRKLDVPHDWSIEGPFSQSNPTGGAGAFLPAGVGWYRKHFATPVVGQNGHVYVEFDGVMANSDVWINGFHLGQRPYGYVSFRYELTGHLNPPGKENILAVRADTSAQPASRWYEGAGIYRHVRLVTVAGMRIDPWGVVVTTSTITATSATIDVHTSITADAGNRCVLQTTIYDPAGAVVTTAASQVRLTTQAGHIVTQEIAVPSPKRWDINAPNIYHAYVQILAADGGKVHPIDDDIVPFGIREFHFDAATGFWLNGRNFKIKGVCLHVDGGAFGIAVPLDVWARRLAELKIIGVNAIRTAHNPPAPEFLDLCDRMGFLVMDEMFDCWTVGKNPDDYHLFFNTWSKIDVADTVRRDRNHPSIILYSAGNEIHDTPKADLAKGILGGLLDVIHQNDPTRPVTQALFRPNASHDYTDGLADMLDVVGQNYREKEIIAAHQQNPARKIIGTENGHDRAYWLMLRDNAPYAGQFLWTGVDYLGEARAWPDMSRPTGLIDRTASPYERGFERASWWSDQPMVGIARRTGADVKAVIDPGYNEAPPASPNKFRRNTFMDWTPDATGTNAQQNVEVYSNCQQVELFLNGKSLGSQPLPPDASPRSWTVPFQPGTLKAVGKNGGAIVATSQLHTAGAASQILLKADRESLEPGWDHVSYVKASIADANGVQVPTGNDEVTFSVSGPGEIAAVDNGNNSSSEPFQAKQRQAYLGQCFAIIRATGSSGPITLTATAPGRKPATITISTQPPQSTAQQ
jgi:beta-galactosidase